MENKCEYDTGEREQFFWYHESEIRTTETKTKKVENQNVGIKCIYINIRHSVSFREHAKIIQIRENKTEEMERGRGRGLGRKWKKRQKVYPRSEYGKNCCCATVILKINMIFSIHEAYGKLTGEDTKRIKKKKKTVWTSHHMTTFRVQFSCSNFFSFIFSVLFCSLLFYFVRFIFMLLSISFSFRFSFYSPKQSREQENGVKLRENYCGNGRVVSL